MPESTPPQILRTKLHRPSLTADFVPRPRLVEQLEGHRQLPLTLVSASAGYGKSTLISSWLDSVDTPHAWLSLDKHDNDLHTFLTYFITAIQAMVPDSCEKTLALLNAIETPPLPVLTKSLTNELDQIEKTFILVLDDYHAIQNIEIHDLINDILNHPPHSLHLVLITRIDPPLPLPALRARGKVSEIRVPELRFTVAETAVFVQNVLKASIDKERATILEAKTEGWIAGLRLTALSLRKRPNFDRLAAVSPESNRFVMDYLFDEILSQLAPGIKEFLMKTAILNRLCGPLCDVVAELDEPVCDGQAYLDWLQDINLFTIPLDDRQKWVRYHHLFQELLLLHLENHLRADDIAALHQKARVWFAENGYLEEALYHALEGGDTGAATRLITQHRHDLMNREQWHRLDSWLHLLPSGEIEKSPELLLLKAWLHETQSRDPDMIAALDKAEALLKDTGLDISARRELQGEIDILRARQFWANNDSKRVEILAKRAIKTLPPVIQYVYGGAKIMLAMAYQVNGNLEQAFAVLNQSYREGERSFGIYQSRLLTAHCMVSWLAADLTELRQMAGEYLRLAKNQDSPDTESYYRYFSGIAFYHLNELEAAERVLLPLFNRDYIVNALGDVHGIFVLTLIKLAQGKIDQADEMLASIINKIMDQQNVGLLSQTQAFRAELALREGRIAEAEAWANRYQVEKPGPMWRFLVPELTLAKVRVFQNTPESRRQAADLLHELLEVCQTTHNSNCLIQVLALQALHQDMEGDQSAALAALERAVTLAEPGGGIRFFVDLGPQMANLLKQLVEKHIAVRYIGKLLAAFREAELQVLPGVVDHQTLSPLSSSCPAGELYLTKRELEILTLLAKRFSNQEISEKLFISTHTVKKHITNIFLKLNVQTRREAVEKAVGLGIFTQK